VSCQPAPSGSGTSRIFAEAVPENRPGLERCSHFSGNELAPPTLTGNELAPPTLTEACPSPQRPHTRSALHSPTLKRLNLAATPNCRNGASVFEARACLRRHRSDGPPRCR